MPPTLVVALDAQDPRRLAAFWADLLGRPWRRDGGGADVLPGDETQVGLRFVARAASEITLGSLHLHLTSDGDEGQDEVVARAVGLGATRLDVGQRPEEGHVVLADPEGNPFCVIERGSSFLAGCGFLGEVACDGSRDVGLFWSAALGWPLVWDEDGETAVQSPLGGTKVAWGGASQTPAGGDAGQRLELEVPADEVTAEVERLRILGATRLVATSATATLADPDGRELRVRGSWA